MAIVVKISVTANKFHIEMNSKLVSVLLVSEIVKRDWTTRMRARVILRAAKKYAETQGAAFK